MPGFGDLLRKNVRVWAVGLQPGLEFNPATAEHPPKLCYDRIEVFPHGGFIYITDEVFEENPKMALQIVKLFIEKIEKLSRLVGPQPSLHEVVSTRLLWRLCVRPELMEYLYQTCNDTMTELSVQESDDTRYVQVDFGNEMVI
jgi:chromo domain-containing protein 1